MKRTYVFDNAQLTEAFSRSKIGDKFYVTDATDNKRSEQNRVYACATVAKKQLAMRKFREGWKATVIE
jgi:hypothetical protein